MAGQERARLIVDDEPLDATEWPVKEQPARPRPDREETEAAAARAGFRKRDVSTGEGAAPTKADKPASVVLNRRRTGRNDQIGIRATTDTKAKFKALAVAMGWSEAVAFERAVDLLERQCGSVSESAAV